MPLTGLYRRARAIGPFGIMNLSKHISKSKPKEVAVISGLMRDDKVSVWSKRQVVVILATQDGERINLSKVIKAVIPESMD